MHLQFAAAFADFSGNAKPFTPAQPLLEECLETVLRHQRARSDRRRLAWLTWTLPLVLLAAVLVWLAWNSQRRWTAAVERLKAEPGIELTAAERSWGTWRFRGLKDPLAAEPAVILAGLGADTTRVDTRWKPYVSLEPGLVTARARQALSAPSTITFRLSHDTLHADGAAPLAWVARAAALPMLPPGISFLGLSGVTATLSPELTALKSRVETRLILFAVGSARVTPEDVGVLDSVATAFRRLSAATGRLGYRADLDLLGRADTTGTDATNQNLSRWRVDAVRALLVGLGIPAEALGGVPLGVSNPLRGRDGLDQAQANRSVAFIVRVQPQPSEPD